MKEIQVNSSHSGQKPSRKAIIISPSLFLTASAQPKSHIQTPRLEQPRLEHCLLCLAQLYPLTLSLLFLAG